MTNKEEFLKNKGWFTWYNNNYWCHNQFDSAERDCTNWGMSLEKAYLFETDAIAKQGLKDGMDFAFRLKNAASNLGFIKNHVG